MKYRKILSLFMAVLMLTTVLINAGITTQVYGLSCEVYFKDIPLYEEVFETTRPVATTETTEIVTDPTEDTESGKVPEPTVTEPSETTDPPSPDCDSKPVPPSETTEPPTPDCDSKPIPPSETTDPPESADPDQPDCDSKPSIVTDPTETTDPSESIPLTGPDGTAPTDPSETTEPSESIPLTGPDGTAPTDPSETTDPPPSGTRPPVSDPSVTTDPTETTTALSSTETTGSVTPQPTVTDPTETTESTAPTQTQPPTETEKPTQATNPTSTAPALSEKTLTLTAGSTYMIEVINANGKRVRYSSTDNSIATVSSSGKITALQKGEITITARIGTKKLKCKVIVKNNPQLKQKGKTVKAVTVKKNKTVTIDLTGKVGTIDNVYTNTTSAKITSGKKATKLKIKGLKKGTTTLKIKVNGVRTLKIKVTVK